MTGGAGFIGSNLVRQLVADGNDVTVLDNLLSGFRSNLDPFPQVRFIEGDIRDDAVVAEAIKGAEVVFHLAASVGNKRSIDYPLVDAEINVMGTLTVLEAARLRGSERSSRPHRQGFLVNSKHFPSRKTTRSTRILRMAARSFAWKRSVWYMQNSMT